MALFPAPTGGTGFKRDQRKKVPPWQRQREPVPAEGRIGKEQKAFNARMMAEWRYLYGDIQSAVSGRTGQIVVGHIEDRSLEPGLRTARSNVAPITWQENREMKFDLELRKEYQAKMRRWVQRDAMKRKEGR